MDNHRATYRSDEQLLALLHETADWFVTTENGEIIRAVASLRDAIEKVEEYVAAGHSIRAVSRHSPSSLIVFNSQIDRLVDLIEDQREARDRRLRATGD